MKIDRFRKKIDNFIEHGNYQVLKIIENNGFLIHHDGKEMLDLSSSDFLGISSNPQLYSEFISENDPELLSFCSTSSRLVSGNHKFYDLLESDLVEYYGGEAAVVFNSRYSANIGILPTLTHKGDLIIFDKSINVSLIDGISLCDCEKIRVNHLDYEQIESIVKFRREEFDNVFVVTDTLFDIDGDFANIQLLCELKREYDLTIYVDESNSVGVRGTNGLGYCEEQGCLEEIDIIVADMSLAYASMGAFLICSSIVKEFLVNTQRSLIYTNSLPSINIAWSRFVLNKMPDYADTRVVLINISNTLRKRFKKQGYQIIGDAHLLSVLCGDNKNSIEMSKTFMDNGYYLLPLMYPNVPKGQSRVSLSLNGAISSDDYKCLIDFIEYAL